MSLGSYMYHNGCISKSNVARILPCLIITLRNGAFPTIGIPWTHPLHDLLALCTELDAHCVDPELHEVLHCLLLPRVPKCTFGLKDAEINGLQRELRVRN